MPTHKLRVAILFGGKSPEHEVSIQSARNIFQAIDKVKYEPVLIAIDKEGNYFHNQKLTDFLLEGNNPKQVLPNFIEDDLIVFKSSAQGKIAQMKNIQQNLNIDVVFPVLHGPFGEDGTIQGLLKTLNKPFVGAGVLGSAVGMDKDIMKRLLRDANLPIGKFLGLNLYEDLPEFSEIVNKINKPFFVKPANMGSSVGVFKINNEEEYKKFVKEAFKFDNKIILEEFISGREIECAVLGNENPQASVVGEIICDNSYYSYDAKYVETNGVVLDIPAKLSNEKSQEIQNLAIKTFKTLNCSGLGRVDFFLKDNGEILINELNSIPGFTVNSMYPKLWQASGINYSDLIDKLIQLSLHKFKKEDNLENIYK